MIHQKFIYRHAAVRLAALGLAVFTQLHATEAQSQLLDHAQIVKAVAAKASFTVPGA